MHLKVLSALVILIGIFQPCGSIGVHQKVIENDDSDFDFVKLAWVVYLVD
jgi:hypothetical protein